MNDITILPPSHDALVNYDVLEPRSPQFRLASRAASTRASYLWHFSCFRDWCRARGFIVDLKSSPAPSILVCEHLSWLAEQGYAAGTISGRLSALNYAHKLAGHAVPSTSTDVSETLAGINRTLGTSPKNRKHAATSDVICAMIATLPHTLAGKRDRAIIALGFAAALRRSELVALNVEDLTEVAQGVRITIRRSKTDQTGAGQDVSVPHGRYIKPYAAVREWLDAAGISDGAIFRTIRKGGHVTQKRLNDAYVAEVVKQAAKKAGLDPRQFAGHSLRAGFVTSAVDARVDSYSITKVTRHKGTAMLDVYVRRHQDFQNHAGESFL
jgi:site-specific recombinase XerD